MLLYGINYSPITACPEEFYFLYYSVGFRSEYMVPRIQRKADYCVYRLSVCYEKLEEMNANAGKQF